MPHETSDLTVSHSSVAASLALTLLLQACTSVPAASTDTAVSAPAASAAAVGSTIADGGEVPELALNLPQPKACDCSPPKAADYTFLEKGYRALLDGEYEDAMQHFQRYQRLETSPRADLEAGIAIAYVQMLPRSSFYDPQTARSAFVLLREQNAKKLKVHDYTRLMRQSLLNMLELQGQIVELKTRNVSLKEDLKKREEALKRLRDLTLNQGQKAAGP